MKHFPFQVIYWHNCRNNVLFKHEVKMDLFKNLSCSVVLGLERTDVWARQTSKASNISPQGAVVHDWSQPSRMCLIKKTALLLNYIGLVALPGWTRNLSGCLSQYKSIKEDHKIRPCTPKSLTFFYGRAVLGCDHNGVLTCFMVYAGIFFIFLARVGSCRYR